MGTLRLDASLREWLASRRAALRTAATRCDAASADWNRRNDEISDLADRSGWDDLKTARIKGANQGLNDAYGATSFWQQEVQRLAADIQAELAYQRVLADAVDEPAPWPAAADRTAPGRRPRPYRTADDAGVFLGGLVEPGPLTDPALRDTNSPTGPAHDNPVAGHPHSVSGPVGAKQGAAGAGVPAAPTGAVA